MIRQFILVSLLLVGAVCCEAQSSKIDSLREDMELYLQKDTVKVRKIFSYTKSLLKENKLDSSLLFVNQGIDLARELKWDEGWSEGLSLLGRVQSFMTDYEGSIETGFKAVKVAESVAKNDLPLFNAYYLLAESYRMLGNDSAAISYGKIALNKAKKINESEKIRNALSILAIAYSQHGNWQQFDSLTNVVFGLTDKENPDMIYLKLLLSKSLHAASQHPSLESIENIKKVLAGSIRLKSYPYISYTQSIICWFYSALKMKDSAYHYGKLALQTASEYKLDKETGDAYGALSNLYYSFGDYKKAYEYQLLFDSVTNVMYNSKSTLKAERARSGFEQEKRDAISKIEREKKDAESERIRDLLYSAILLFGLIALFSYRYSRQKLKAKKKIEKAYAELVVAQKQLIQSEKMASLGELTAGIAHEIQNPLNFVNNFSDINKELLEELTVEADNGNLDAVKEIASDILVNEEKINHHGKRADAIVKGMLQHSRTSTGQKEPTDINALCDEYFRLAYHGMRAKDKLFNCSMKTEFDSSLPKIKVVPQDIGRVFLNLISNAFFTVNEKSKQNIPGYQPTVSVCTKYLSNKVEISVSDNGNGIPENINEKIFQPFFTTKPTGQGTGLGLSLSYDIIKAHSGEMKVESKEGEGTKFIIQIPIIENG